MNDMKKKASVLRAVTFASSTNIKMIDPSSSLSNTEKRNIWYDYEELSTFRRNAQDEAVAFVKQKLHSKSKCPLSFHTNGLCFLKSLKRTHEEFSTSVIRQTDNDTIQQLEETRGLEIRINPERIKNRHISRFAVLEIQRRLKAKNIDGSTQTKIEEEKNIAKIAIRFSGWAREIAQRVGQIDAFAANNFEVIDSKLCDMVEHEERRYLFSHEDSISRKRLKTNSTGSSVIMSQS